MRKTAVIACFASFCMLPAAAEDCTFEAKASGNAWASVLRVPESGRYLSGLVNIEIKPDCLGDCSGRIEVDFTVVTTANGTKSVTVEWPWSSKDSESVTVTPETPRMRCRRESTCSVRKPVLVRTFSCAESG